MVEGGVEHGQLVLIALGLDDREGIVPGCPGLGRHGLKILSCRLRLQIPDRSGGAHPRQGDLHLQFPALRGVELEPGSYLPAPDFREIVLQVELAVEPAVEHFPEFLSRIGLENDIAK